MAAKFELTSIPLGLVPFLLRQRALPAPIRFLLRENLPLLPEHVRIEGSVEGLAESLVAGLPPTLDPSLRDWLAADIEACARRLCDMAESDCASVRLEKATDRTCPRFHVDSVTMRLLCTYCGPGTEWADANTAYSVNFGEPFDEMLIHQVPTEAIVIYGGANASAELHPLWHRSPAVPGGETRLLLCIDPVP
ncbi:DUF1826 domain-containing protein [Aestuariivirga sp.]|uniref:DUF1826 domain-containing protein n=1 Tax=Aestuariivirga sp. TaxID=2650926 RepID=UPI003BA99D3A